MTDTSARVSSSGSGPDPAGPQDPATLQARFDAEVQVAGIAVSDEDRGPLYAMWTELVPIRARLRAADIAVEEEPSFTQKPAQPGAGITLAGVPSASAATVDGPPVGGTPAGGPA